MKTKTPKYKKAERDLDDAIRDIEAELGTILHRIQSRNKMKRLTDMHILQLQILLKRIDEVRFWREWHEQSAEPVGLLFDDDTDYSAHQVKPEYNKTLL